MSENITARESEIEETAKELYFFAVGSANYHQETDTQAKAILAKNYRDNKQQFLFKQLAISSIRKYAKEHADRQWGDDIIADTDIVKALTDKLRKYYTEEFEV